MAKREALVKAYMGALQARAVLVLAAPGGLSAKVSPDPDPQLELFDALWFAKPQHAELVLSQCPEGVVECSAARLRDEVINIAAALGASWLTTAELEASASNSRRSRARLSCSRRGIRPADSA